ncbi:hypothetical protein A4X13_0g4775 [Tilletia indica]|uniref:Uncharacterized protein n=1 Tax=Tilletia indica TaxID=43049 RepID=A0A8T8SXW1_9BASI|nr:hypothetical protein A4X13_0g4775 [Tilletia indica]
MSGHNVKILDLILSRGCQPPLPEPYSPFLLATVPKLIGIRSPIVHRPPQPLRASFHSTSTSSTFPVSYDLVTSGSAHPFSSSRVLDDLSIFFLQTHSPPAFATEMHSDSISRSSVSSTVMRPTSLKHQSKSYDVEAIIARRRARMAALRARHEQEQVFMALQTRFAGICLTDVATSGPLTTAQEGNVAENAPETNPGLPNAA